MRQYLLLNLEYAIYAPGALNCTEGSIVWVFQQTSRVVKITEPKSDIKAKPIRLNSRYIVVLAQCAEHDISVSVVDHDLVLDHCKEHEEGDGEDAEKDAQFGSDDLTPTIECHCEALPVEVKA